MPASCAMRLTALLTPEASPSSSSVTLDITEAVSGATSSAKERPSSAMGASTPNDERGRLAERQQREGERGAERAGDQHGPRADLVGQRAERPRQQADAERERQERQAGVGRRQCRGGR